jgi:hypothetical protein
MKNSNDLEEIDCGLRYYRGIYLEELRKNMENLVTKTYV